MAKGKDGKDAAKNPESLSVLGADNVIPGEAVVKLRSDAASSVSSNVPALLPGASRAGAATASFGVPSLDSVLSRIGATAVTRIHGAMPTEVSGGMTFAGHSEVESAFHVRFDPSKAVDDVVAELQGLDEVESAEPNYWREAYVVPNDPQYPAQWGLAKIRCPEAWERTTGSNSVVVAVVDTGVDLNHPELQSLLVPGRDLVDLGPSPAPPMSGWVWEGDFNGVDGTPQDEVGHGTHVAGTIACTSNDNRGVAGVTWSCRLMPVKVLNRARRLSDNRISGFGSSATIAAGIRWAADHGARVINLSLGGSNNTTVERDAVAYAIGRDCVVVAAMGNDGTANPSYPAAFTDVVAVGATTPSDAKASFSQTGGHIDVAAPGTGVLSTYWDNTYETLNGTSMASPHVAGVAALIRSCNGRLSGAQVAQIIRDTAKPLRDNPSDPVPNNNYGHGLVDAKAALDRACPLVRTVTTTCKSTVVVCKSMTVTCRPSVLITCKSVKFCPSVRVICASVDVQCPPSRLAKCPPSQLTVCPTMIRCPSLASVCPSGPVCEIEDLPIRPTGEDDEFDPEGDDPYGYDYGYEQD